MTISTKGLLFIKDKEGILLKAYTVGDRPTIGYGNTYYENGNPVKLGDKITIERAEKLYRNILTSFSVGVNKLVKSKVNQNQFDALVSYAYNRGLDSLKNSGLLRLVNSNPNNLVIKKQFLIDWGTNQAKKEALLLRRQKEADLYFSTSLVGSVSSFLAFVIIVSFLYLKFKR